MAETLTVIEEGFADRPSFGTAVSEAIMRRVAAGELGPTLRLHVPGRELAFSRQDRASPGIDRAVEAARAQGFAPVLRMAGGRAAVFTERTLALALALPAEQPAKSTNQRFELVSAAVRDTLSELGIDARVGEIEGEYCPGAWSVNARGETKIAGIGQRMIRGAGHVGAVIVVDGVELINDVLTPVYEALELDWDPEVTGSVANEVHDAGLELVASTLLDRFAKRYELVEGGVDETTLSLAAELEQGHDLSAGAAAARGARGSA